MPFAAPIRAAAERMLERLDSVRAEGDSLGGVVVIIAEGVPAGSGRAGLRQAGRRPGQGAHEHWRGEGGGDRRGL